MKKRWFLVIIMFAIPLAVILILHSLGENRFDVPVFHTTGEGVPEICSVVDYPFYVDEQYRFKDSISVIFILPPVQDADSKLQVLRIKDRFNNRPVKSVIYLDSLLNTCDLLVPDNLNTVLVDGRGRIRGYYMSKDREEIDRLAVETEILLTNGENESEEKKKF